MAEHFSKEVLKVSIAKICRRQSIDAADEHAFDTLVDVVGKYIESIGMLTKTFAEHDGRTKGTLVDLLQAFECLEPNRMRWKELITMADMAMWEISFPTGIPDYPVHAKKQKKLDKNNRKYGDKTAADADNPTTEALPPYAPAFFPTFPQPHTYKVTLVNATAPIEDPKEVVEKKLAEKILVQNALAKIDQQENTEKSSKSFGQTSNSDQNLFESTSNVGVSFAPPKPADAFL
eukprot:CAMPEP_0204830338 /NCGR_PEP_ID=MMETSP1346-20131115/8475_1 /ASSEMBLY_ACC=CAM_ASM_000771 /TAXON_ID=215587 /ORGANISM="Aplanochytrium stocchinoi, Strain GSBS06" /LENGTH=232 /DNA_ID=CAMNT_0051960517 /DNA_START=176 /DNA_END=874 /DNA_ORIENTATION=-